MMTPPQADARDEKYARWALQVLTAPHDEDWYNSASRFLDQAPDYAYAHDANGESIQPRDVYELAGRTLAYFAGLVEWKPAE